MWIHRAQSENFVVEITGGSVKISDRHTGELLKVHKGYNYLYTGDIKPDENEMFALENGKHFYVFSLRTFEQIKKVTLPRSYESIDVYGSYIDEGRQLVIPARRYVYENRAEHIGHYEYMLFIYDTTDYSLIDKRQIANPEQYRWKLSIDIERFLGMHPDRN